MRSEIEYRNQLMAQTISRETSFMFDKMINDIRVISEFLLKDSEEDINFYLAEMDRLVAKNPLYLFIDVVDKNEESLVTIPNVHNSSSPELIHVLNRLKWSKTFYISNLITLEDGRKTIAIAYPILDKQGNYRGGIVAYVNLHILAQYFKQGKIGDEGVNVLVDRNGTIIVHSDQELIGKSIKSHILVDYLNKDRLGIWEGYLFLDKMLVSYRPIEAGSFGLIVGETVEQAMAPAQAVQTLLFKGFILVLAITFLLTLVGTFRVVKPITSLTKQAKEYKEGKRKEFNRIKTGDEIEDLSTTMASMAEELKYKERYLFYILESIPYGVITTDKDGKVVTYNKGAENLLVYQRKEAIGKYIYELPIKKSKEEFLTWQTIKEGKEFNELETYIFDKNGKRHDVKLYSSLFCGEDEQIIGAILILRDESEIKKLEEYLKQSERLSSIGQLTAGMAHEIKNPLNIIQAAAEAIQLEVNESSKELSFVYEMTEDIVETTDRLNSLLTDLLKLTKGEEDEQKKRVNLYSVIDELLSLLKNKLNDQSIVVTSEYVDREAYVYANESKLTQVFLNIMINSMHAMEHGGSLFIRLKDIKTSWEIEIEDTGKGIPESELKWIFNPFYTTKKEGTGLGLSIAYEIITQHHGNIAAYSSDNGTTLTIQLPKQEIGGNDENEEYFIS
jgi:PAS domain S-box-containing protein